MGLNLKRTTPNNQFEAIDALVKTEIGLSDALHLLESIMLHSDIDNDKESGGLTTWKQKIMKELMKHGYSWDGDAHTANLFVAGKSQTMSDINEILETAHITTSTATLKVVVDDLSKFKVLFEPRSFLVDDGSNDDPDGAFAGIPIYEEDPKWKKEMKFPTYVLSVSPWSEDNTLSVWVEHPFDLKELSDWLKTFER